MIKIITTLFTVFITVYSYSQISNTSGTYKKRVLENAEVEIIASYYSQDGDNAAVTGGIGTEKLTDIASSFIVSIPLNDDDVLSIDATISAYSSASSSNLNPFDGGGGGGDDFTYSSNSVGSPWVESSGASKSDVWANGILSYNHSSVNRNTILDANLSFASEYDYTSFGVGGSYTKLYNEKNTVLSLKTNIYFDSWNPWYPKEISSYLNDGQSINSGFFKNIAILDQNGSIIDKNGMNVWNPLHTILVDNTSRNTYSLSLSFLQILSKKAQISIFLDLVQQKGWLANPMQRVYFADKDNYFIGNKSSIPNYTSPANIDVFQLADDIERLPETRFKIPIGARFNYYLNEVVSLRTYYRYYYDDWGIVSHTASVELPIKIADRFTLYPSYRFYNQTTADYFAPFEQHQSAEEFYTSDYDLSEFNSNQFGFGLSYTDIFTKRKIWKLGLKNVDLKYSNYKRNTGLSAGIISLGLKFVMD